MASSSFPCVARAVPRLKWVVASSGLEPDRLAVLGDGLVQLPLAHQGDAEVGVGVGEVGLEPDRLAQGRDGLLQRRIGPGAIPAHLEEVAQAAPVPAVTGPKPTRSWNTADRLVAAAPALQRMRQLVAGLGPQGAGRRVVADRLLGPRRMDRLQLASQVVVEPDVARVVRLGAAEQVGGGLVLVGLGQGAGQERQARRRPGPRDRPASPARATALAGPWDRAATRPPAVGRGSCRGRRRGPRRSAGASPRSSLGRALRRWFAQSSRAAARAMATPAGRARILAAAASGPSASTSSPASRNAAA